MLKWIKRVLGASTPAEAEFKTVVYTTRPDPALHMTERVRRYHLNNHAGR